MNPLPLRHRYGRAGEPQARTAMKRAMAKACGSYAHHKSRGSSDRLAWSEAEASAAKILSSFESASPLADYAEIYYRARNIDKLSTAAAKRLAHAAMERARAELAAYPVVHFANETARQEFEALWIQRSGGPPVQAIVDGIMFAGDDADRARDIANEVVGVRIT